MCIFFKDFWALGQKKKWGDAIASKVLAEPAARTATQAWTSGRGELCLVCVKDQTHWGWDSSQQDTRFLSGCCQLVLLCGGVKLCRLKTSGFSPAVCTQKESCTGQSKFTEFLSDTFSWPWYDKLGRFLRMNPVSSCATVLSFPWLWKNLDFNIFKCSTSSHVWKYPCYLHRGQTQCFL